MSSLPFEIPPAESTLSILLLFITLYSYQATWTPPQAKAPDSIRVGTKHSRLFPKHSRELAAVARAFVTAHFISEIYALYSFNTSPHGLSKSSLNAVCPNQVLRKSYTSHHIPPTA